MIIDASVVLARVLLIAIVPLAAMMASRAWRIGVRHDLSRVAVLRGQAPEDPARWARAVLTVNLLGALTLLAILVTVLTGSASFSQWAGAVGLVLWIYISALQLIARRAHRR